MSDKLEEYRLAIDRIDQQIVELFEQRMLVSKGVAQYKLENKLPIFNEEREKIVLQKRADQLKNPEYKEVTLTFVQTMMDCSKKVQQKYLEEKK